MSKLTCVICDKKFNDEQDRLNHMNNELCNTNTNLKINYINMPMNNIILIPFGKEDIGKYITDDETNKLLEYGIDSIIELIKLLHFDINKPKLHNCYKTNLKNNTVCIYTTDEWDMICEDEIYNTIKIKSYYFLNNKYNEMLNNKKITDKAKAQFSIYSNITNENITPKNYINNVKILFYNNRHIIEKTKNIVLKNQKKYL